MAFDNPTQTFLGRGLAAYIDPMLASEWDANFGPGATVEQGRLLLQVAAAAADVQTITMTATGGTFTVTVTVDGAAQTTPAQAFNVSTANLQAALVALANVGAGNVVVTGTAGTSYVLTFGGALGNRPIPLATLGTGALTGGTATIAHTTTGAAAGTFTPYTGTGTPKAINKYPLATDASGQVTFGVPAAGETPAGGVFGERYRSAPVFLRGTFRTTDLVGLDQNAIDTMNARLLSGTIADGVVLFP